MAFNYGRPVELRSDNDFEEMTDGDMAYVANLILEKFAEDDTGVGSVNINGTGSGIGVFVNTRYDSVVGTHPVDSNNITEVEYAFKQNLSAVTLAASDYVKPIAIDSGNTDIRTVADGRDATEFPDPQIAVQAMDLGLIKSTIIDKCLTKLTAGGVGSYYIGENAPASGTWKEISSFTDTSRTDTVGATAIQTNTTYKLWRKTDDGVTYTVRRPLYLRSDNDVQQMSDTDIENMVKVLQYYIVTTGLGNYAIQETAPATGTWGSRGSSSDIRQDVGNISYTGNFVGTYQGDYTGDFTNQFTAQYVGQYLHTYTGTYSGDYTRNYSGDYSGGYTRLTTRTTSTASFTSVTSTTAFAGTSQSTIYYGGTSTVNITKNKNFIANYTTSYQARYTTTFTGRYTGTYTGYSSADFTGTYSGDYSKLENETRSSIFYQTFSSDFTGYYDGTYSDNFTGATILSQEITVSGTPVTLWQRTA